MKKQTLENVSIGIGSLAFYLLFWQEKMGINSLIFTLAIFSLLFLNKKELFANRPAMATAAGTLITAIMVVLNNSLMTKVIHLVSFTTAIGFIKQRELRLLFYPFLLSIISFCETPLNLAKRFTNSPEHKNLRLAPVLRSFRISLIPLIVLIVFYAIYHASNPAFRSVSNHFWLALFDWFSWNLSFTQMAFFILGLFITATVFWKSNFPVFKELQKNHREKVRRLRNKTPRLFRGMIALKSEFQSGLILLSSLNILLLVVNIIDIKNYWLGSSYQLPPLEMKAMVHQGTYFLITALLLAMFVISYFFRKNLNFYPSNTQLKIAGYSWTIQNVVLAISLFIKNYRYIEANDLAYKRIGVLIFLVLVFAGLITMILKIRDQKSFYFLLHRNAWIAYAVFIICSCINWDVWITRYNLSNQTKSAIDFAFLIEDVSDKNIHLLLEHQQQHLIPEHRERSISFALQAKQTRFLAKQEGLSWLSWNLADHKIHQYLKHED